MFAGVLSLWACNGGEDKKPNDDIDDFGNAQCDLKCDIDSSTTVDTAFDGSLSAATSDLLCPSADVDFWRYTIPAGDTLVSLDALYEKLTNMELTADWYGPQGACVPTSPTDCSSSSCPPGQTCDAARGGCRRLAPDELCTQDSHCQGGEECVFAETLLTRLVEASDSGSQHRVVDRVAAMVAGDYTLKIFDGDANACDTEIEYSLAVSADADPDLHEPIDAPNMATVATSGVALTGYLSHRGKGDGQSSVEKSSDVDWYLITPAFASRPMITVTLESPTASQAVPTYTLVQGAYTNAAPAAVTEGGGNSDAKFVRRSAVLLPAAGPVYVKVSNTVATSDISHPYTLSVAVYEDTSEGLSRDDDPGSAAVFSAGLPTSGSTFNDTGTIIASNDQDWYRVDTSTAVGENSLIHILAQAAAPDVSNFVMQMTLYRPNGATCTSDTCAGGARCDTVTDQCLTAWLVRPSPDLLPGAQQYNPPPGDPQRGGLTPNRLETQLPLLGTGTGVIYVQITHNNASVGGFTGYSTTQSYSLTMSHKQEPDLVDRSDPDNNFVARPLGPNVSQGSFFRSARTVSTTTSGAGTFGTSAWVSGIISYEGDQDFFTIPISPGFAPGGMTLYLRYPASKVDIRATMTRGTAGGTIAPIPIASMSNTDICLTNSCSAGGTCDTRNQCSQGSYDGALGPEATTQDCIYVTSGSSIDVWVNDINSNDWDESSQYEFQVSLVEGCPVDGVTPLCDSFVCTP